MSGAGGALVIGGNRGAGLASSAPQKELEVSVLGRPERSDPCAYTGVPARAHRHCLPLPDALSPSSAHFPD